MLMGLLLRALPSRLIVGMELGQVREFDRIDNTWLWLGAVVIGAELARVGLKRRISQ